MLHRQDLNFALETQLHEPIVYQICQAHVHRCSLRQRHVGSTSSTVLIKAQCKQTVVISTRAKGRRRDSTQSTTSKLDGRRQTDARSQRRRTTKAILGTRVASQPPRSYARIMKIRKISIKSCIYTIPARSPNKYPNKTHAGAETEGASSACWL